MNIKVLLVDLDNTLYPASSALSGEISRRISSYISKVTGVNGEEATRLRRAGFEKYGTSLKWLEAEYNFTETADFLRSVHPEDVRNFLPPPDSRLRPCLQNIELPKYILTNSSVDHATRVLDYLGIRDLFGEIYDITYNGLRGKPHANAYQNPLREIGQSAESSLFIDDVPSYLQGFADIGGNCLLVDEMNRHEENSFPRIRSILELPAWLDSL